MGIIDVEDLTVVRNDFIAIEDVSFHIPEGKVSVILGSSGSGKSSLIKAMAGIIPYEKGKIYTEGKEISELSEDDFLRLQARTGFMFQDAALWSNKSVFDNLAYPILVMQPDINKLDLKAQVEAKLASVHFDFDPAMRPSAISDGERKLVSLLRATVTSPEILFLDDPSSSLDRNMKQSLLKLITDYQERNKSVIIATHEISFVRDFSEFLILLERGKVFASGDPNIILNDQSPDMKAFLQNF